ncbi:hypothetical protein [Streptomyces sp. LARHCF252]
MKVKAIETRYAGCRFRSRLEARWAVFFDALDIDWEYEPEGFETQHGWYLPDFWLPESKAWVEIKGGKPTKRDLLKCSEVAREEWTKGHRFRILTGDIPRAPLVVSGTGPLGLLCNSWSVYPGPNVALPALGSSEPAHSVLPGQPGDVQGFITAGWLPAHDKIEDISQALTKARSARFEHGERG